jgi:dTDP-4-dehydrorhamnose 3,5-epimerase-like enzyme
MSKNETVIVSKTPVLGLWCAQTTILPDPERDKTFGIPYQAGTMGLDFDVQQVNFSITTRHGTTGGWHVEPLASKLIFLTSGYVYNPVVCLDPSSPNFLRVERIWLEPGITLIIPPRYGNGFQTLVRDTSDAATYVYARNMVHIPEDDWAVSIDDPNIEVSWPEAPGNMSRRDIDAMSVERYLDRLHLRMAQAT